MTLPTPISWTDELKGCQILLKSGLVPKDVRTAEAALFIVLCGRDLGLSPVQSLRSVRVIQGKPEISADVQLSMFHRSGGKSRWVTLTDKEATLELQAVWSLEPHRTTFTVEDARRAELMSNPTWRKYPKAMLRSRAITSALKDIGFLLGAGVYAPGELGGSVTVDEATGEVLPADDGAVPTREISSTAGVVESLDDQQRESLENHALTISEAFRKAETEAALNDWNSLENDDKVAVWAMLNKDVQKMLKAAQKAAKEWDYQMLKAAQATESGGPPTVTLPTLLMVMRSRKDVDLLDADYTLAEALPEADREEAGREYHEIRQRLTK